MRSWRNGSATPSRKQKARSSLSCFVVVNHAILLRPETSCEGLGDTQVRGCIKRSAWHSTGLVGEFGSILRKNRTHNLLSSGPYRTKERTTPQSFDTEPIARRVRLLHRPSRIAPTRAQLSNASVNARAAGRSRQGGMPWVSQQARSRGCEQCGGPPGEESRFGAGNTACRPRALQFCVGKDYFPTRCLLGCR